MVFSYSSLLLTICSSLWLKASLRKDSENVISFNYLSCDFKELFSLISIEMCCYLRESWMYKLVSFEFDLHLSILFGVALLVLPYFLYRIFCSASISSVFLLDMLIYLLSSIINFTFSFLSSIIYPFNYLS